MTAPAVARPADRPRQAHSVEAVSLPKFRRCTFRRVEATDISRALVMYDVECLHPERVAPQSMGDLAMAHPVCAGCTLPGIFRPDAD